MEFSQANHLEGGVGEHTQLSFGQNSTSNNNIIGFKGGYDGMSRASMSAFELECTQIAKKKMSHCRGQYAYNKFSKRYQNSGVTFNNNGLIQEPAPNSEYSCPIERKDLKIRDRLYAKSS